MQHFLWVKCSGGRLIYIILNLIYYPSVLDSYSSFLFFQYWRGDSFLLIGSDFCNMVINILRFPLNALNAICLFLSDKGLMQMRKVYKTYASIIGVNPFSDVQSNEENCWQSLWYSRASNKIHRRFRSQF